MSVGGAVSTVHVNICVHVDELPQRSVALYVLVCERKQPSEEILPSELVTLTWLQPSETVGVPGAGTPAGLQPRSLPAGHTVNTGGVISTVHVNV